MRNSQLGYEDDRYKVVVEFIIRATNPDEAEEVMNEMIQQGILRYIDLEEQEPMDEYEVIDIEPAEVF